MSSIILNGPLGIGKDCLADAIVEQSVIPAKHMRIKTALYEAAYDWIRERGSVVTWKHFLHLCTDRVLKELDTKMLLGFSPRGLLIHVSETVIKPMYGNDFFGLRALEAQQAWRIEIGVPNAQCWYSDGGFPAEVDVLSMLGPVVVVQLSADWTQFDERDSRGYIEGPQTIKFHRTWDALESDAAEIIALVNSLL